MIVSIIRGGEIMRRKATFFLILFINSIVFMLNPLLVSAEWVMPLEHTHHWDIGTTPRGFAAIRTADLNDDGRIEIVYIGTTGEFDIIHAVLRVMNWDGSFLRVRATEQWTLDDTPTRGHRLFCGDLNDDSESEILTIVKNDFNQSELKVWRFNGFPGSLSVEAVQTLETPGIQSLAVGDVDGDGETEILIGESATAPPRFRIRIMRYDGTGFLEEHTENWQIEGVGGSVEGLAIGDIDTDGEVEIIAAVNAHRQIHIQVMYWDGTVIHQEISGHWSILDQTDVHELCLGNLDDDPYLELVVAGTAMDLGLSSPQFGCLSVWQWDLTDLSMEAQHAWQSTSGNVEFLGCSVNNINSDDLDEIIIAGPLHENPAMNILRVYNLVDSDLNAMFSQEWITEGMTECFAYTVHSANVDRDHPVEILTGGRAVAPGSIDKHELTIWSVWFRVDAPSWLSWLENILGFRGWPLYLRARDLIPMPWPIVIYTFVFISLVIVVSWGVIRLIRLIRKPISKTPVKR